MSPGPSPTISTLDEFIANGIGLLKLASFGAPLAHDTRRTSTSLSSPRGVQLERAGAPADDNVGDVSCAMTTLNLLLSLPPFPFLRSEGGVECHRTLEANGRMPDFSGAGLMPDAGRAGGGHARIADGGPEDGGSVGEYGQGAAVPGVGGPPL
ncbi:hypothetical protein K438DRAFT_1979003 [Mycena galopus ATCC 62051]|nr:hypothetical protein K438DRAFT_1979003 [Mycena galopus ATCC 62051]